MLLSFPLSLERIITPRDQTQSPFMEKGLKRKGKGMKEKKLAGAGIAWILAKHHNRSYNWYVFMISLLQEIQ
jgi:hypothetical protein